MKHVKVEFCWSEGTLQEREGGAFRKTWKTKCLIAAALYNRLGEKEQIVSRLLQKIQQSYCSPSCWIKAMPGWTLLQTLEDVWLWDFRVFQKYMKCRKTSLLCQNTSAFCLHFPLLYVENNKTAHSIDKIERRGRQVGGSSVNSVLKSSFTPLSEM